MAERERFMGSMLRFAALGRNGRQSPYTNSGMTCHGKNSQGKMGQTEGQSEESIISN